MLLLRLAGGEKLLRSRMLGWDVGSSVIKYLPSMKEVLAMTARNRKMKRMLHLIHEPRDCLQCLLWKGSLKQV